jgi:mgtE-like transporter
VIATIQGINNVNIVEPTEETVQLAHSANRFTSIFKQSLFALSFDLGGLVAGSILVIFSDVFALAPWVIIIYPAILSMRGVIGGLFSGHLTTGLHLGTVTPVFTHNTREFRVLQWTMVVLTSQSSLMMGGVASILNVLFWGGPATEAITIFSVILTAMGLSLLFVQPATLAISVLAFKHGLDPDIIVYPVISTFADILVTGCFILALRTTFLFGSTGMHLTGLFAVGFLIVALCSLYLYRKEQLCKRTIEEFTATLIVVTLIVSITGNVLGEISKVIGTRPEIYMLYPALIDTVGDVGSIVGSTTTTKLALGTVSSSLKSVRANIPEIWGACSALTIWFTIFSAISFFITRGYFSYELFSLIGVLLMLSILAAPIMSVIAYGIAVTTFKRGLDPDNFVIPFESSLSDTVTTTCLLFVLSLFMQAQFYL